MEETNSEEDFEERTEERDHHEREEEGEGMIDMDREGVNKKECREKGTPAHLPAEAAIALPRLRFNRPFSG